MRVGFSGTFWGQENTGSGQYVRRLVKAVERYTETETVLFLPRYMNAREIGETPSLAHCVATPLDRWHENLAKTWYEQLGYPRACRERVVDVAHVPYFAPPLFPTTTTVVTIHDLIPLILPAYRGSSAVRLYMALVSHAARRAAVIITDSHASARDIQRLLDISVERLRVIPLAADAAYRPLPPEQRKSVLKHLGVPSRYLLYLGGFDRRKNVSGLLRAYARVRGELDDIPLVIAGRLPTGDTGFTPHPKRIAKELGIGAHVHYTGWVTEADKPALYAGATAFCFPSRYEGFGLPVLEAISCGTPAIVGGESSLEEVAGPGGVAVPRGDVDALADALIHLVGDPDLRRSLAQKGLAHARGFSWRATAEKTAAAYREALAMGNPG
jgi:glycosyltransferase involved in cell wall biosynthesis